MRSDAHQNTGREITWGLVRFSLPLILSGMLQQLYNWVDALIVGNMEGEVALGAIGVTSSPINFFVTLMTGFTLGLSVWVARSFGEKRTEHIPSILSLFSLVGLLLFAVVGGLGLCFSRQFLLLLRTPADALPPAVDYIRVIGLGFPFLAVYNVYSAVLRGIGDSRTPFLSIVISSLVNVVLDLLFVVVLAMGVRGAAIATVLSQIAMTVFTVVYSSRKHTLLRFSPVRTGWRELLSRGASFGFPPMLQSCITSLGILVLQNFMNGFGTQTVTAITSAYRIDTLVLLPVVNLSAGISTFTAHSYGEGDSVRERQVLRAGLGVMFVVSLVLTAIVVPTGGKLIGLFGAGEEAVSIGSAFFVRLASFYPIYGLANAYRGYLEGIGDLVYSSAIGIVCLLVRIGLSYLLEPFSGNMVIAYAEMISWVLLLALYFLRATQKRKERGDVNFC